MADFRLLGGHFMEGFSFILLFTAQIENCIAIVVVVVGFTYQIADLTQLGNQSDQFQHHYIGTEASLRGVYLQACCYLSPKVAS